MSESKAAQMRGQQEGKRENLKSDATTCHRTGCCYLLFHGDEDIMSCLAVLGPGHEFCQIPQGGAK